MIKDRNISTWVVYQDNTVLEALYKISLNNMKHIYVVDEHDILIGVFSDGDFRRWATSNTIVDMQLPVDQICNRDYSSVSIDDPTDKIEPMLNEQITTLPLLNAHGHIVGVARKGTREIVIANKLINHNSPAFLIAEIGNNHNGSIKRAKELVDKVCEAGADCAKFQLRNMEELYRASSGATSVTEDLGSQYTLDLLKKFQLTNDELCEVFDYCKLKGILPLCTPWDIESLKVLEDYGVDAYKVASADLNNTDLLEAISETGKPIICSTGMSREHEIIQAVSVLNNKAASFSLLHCNSTYPAPFKDINLTYMARLKEIGNCVVGYSGHERGISIPIAAVAQGAKIIEKHFTLDRNMEGNDHKVSLHPEEFKSMVDAIREVEFSLGSATERTITQGELINRETLGKSLVAAKNIKRGEIFTNDSIVISAPGKGLPPYQRKNLVGLMAKRDIEEGDFLYESDISTKKSALRNFSFKRRFGIPVRYWDFSKMIDVTNLGLVEFHFSYNDLKEDPKDWIREKYPIKCVIHSPELFANDHILNLCADDEAYRQHSIQELQNVIDTTRSVAGFFDNDEPTQIVVNVGGFTNDYHLPAEQRPKLYDRLLESLSKLDTSEVEIIPQTMPPFPWHFGGQSHHNIFVDSGEIAKFCKDNGYRICLDLSHSKLASNFYKFSFSEFLEEVGMYVAHLHIADAEHTDGEGLQVGEGDIDFSLIAKILDKTAPNASFIPEIWQGHKDSGEGFWYALNELERWF